MMAGLGDVGGGSGGAGDSGSGSGGGGASSDSGTGAGAGGGTTPASGSGAGGSTDKGGDAGLGKGTEAAKSWRDALPDDIKADPTLSKYSDITNLSKAHIDLQKKFGQKGIFKPGKDASPEAIKAFREELGIPTDASKYDMGKFEGVEVPEVTLKWAQKLGSEHGIEPAALKAVMTDYMKLEAQNKVLEAQTAKTDMQKGLETLKTEWGDAYDRNLSRANFAAEKLGGKPFIEALVKANVHNNPALLKALSEAAKLYGEDKLREAGAGDGRQTPVELEAEIAQVQGRLFAMKPTDGAYQSVKAKYEALWRTKTGGK